MDIMLKIALGAVGVVAVILSLGFVNILTDNSAECEKMNRSHYEHELAFNQSAQHYRYRVNTLEGELDLPGDLAAWRNHLLNKYSQLQHENTILENKCQS
jgi:hypothetical protein